MDPFDDDLFGDAASKPVRAVGRFQPKLKPRPVKKGPVTAPSSQIIRSNDADKVEKNENLKAAEPSARDDPQCLGSTNGSSGEHTVSAENGCAPSGSQMTDADILVGLESLDERTKAIESSIPSSEAPAEEQLSIPITLPSNGSAPESHIDDVQNSEMPSDQDPMASGEPVVTIHGVSQIDSIDQGIEEIEAYPSLEASDGPDLTTISGKRTMKFQPKPKVQMNAENCDTQDSQPTDSVYKERLSAFASDDVLDLSSLGFDHASPTEPTPEVPVNEDMPDVDSNFLAEGPSSSGVNEDEDNDEVQVENESIDNDEDFQVENESRKKRPRRKPKEKTGNKDNDEEFQVEDESLDNDEEFQVENESRKKKALRKPKEKADNKEKPVRKRKKTTDETDKAIEEKPKKFSHRTRQKRRMVDKALLETPEDEIDFQNVPIRDLILLAEHNERLTKKVPPSQPPSQTPQVNPSGLGNSSGFNNEEDGFNFDGDEDGEAFGEQPSAQVEDTTEYFNYQTYMVKTPRVRWSKQDTELFYEAVRQFGSDFSMIQQLFPGRERKQILLKFKNEQRRHPARINDALTSRAQGHSYFEQVIERLKKMAAEEKQNDDDGVEESVDLTAEEEAEGHKEEEEPKSEHVEEKESHEDTEQDVTQAQNPVDEEFEEDDDIWSQYKSDI